MPGPYLPVTSVSRSQSVRLGRGPGSAVVNELDMGDIPINPQTGALVVLYYANLGDPLVRRDYQRHAALGAIDSVGTLSTSVYSDMFAKTGLATTAGTGLAVNVSAGTLVGRTFGGSLEVSAVTNLALAASSATLGRVDLAVINNLGVVSVVTGVSSAAQVFEVDSVATSGVPTGGTFTLQYTYNSQTFTTTALAYNASAGTVATAVQAAGNLPGTWTGSGGSLPTAVTLTASGAFTGTLSGLTVSNNSLTGGTTPAATYTQTTAGVPGPVASTVGGNVQPLASFNVLAGATVPTTFTSMIPSS